MKNKLLLFLLPFICLSCAVSDDPPIEPGGGWKETAVFPGPGRDAAFSFVLNDQFYVGMGAGIIGDQQQELVDFYQYNAATDSWLKKADVPAAGRLAAVGFSINGKGYVGLGSSLDCPSPAEPCEPVLSHDIWEYDPLLDSWKMVAHLDDVLNATHSQNLTSFVAAGKAYIVGGSWLWQFDPHTYAITAQRSCPEYIAEPAAFVLNNKAYVTTAGTTDLAWTNAFSKKFYEYDPATDTWTQKADFAGEDRKDAFGFALKGKGYLGGGDGTTVDSAGIKFVTLRDMWQYDPAADQWTQVEDYPGPGAFRRVAGALTDRAIIGLGASYSTSVLFPKDVWQYQPE